MNIIGRRGNGDHCGGSKRLKLTIHCLPYFFYLVRAERKLSVFPEHVFLKLTQVRQPLHAATAVKLILQRSVTRSGVLMLFFPGLHRKCIMYEVSKVTWTPELSFWGGKNDLFLTW